MNVVKFKYYDDFHCLGPECRDTCCRYWRICINKREYLNYKKIKCSPELRNLLDNAFKRQKDATDFYYAHIKLNDDENCPLLGQDSLCMLQKELGEDALSMTCAVFPRLHSSVGGKIIMESCSATCYHVVELLMNHPEGLLIVEEEYNGKDKHMNRGLYSSYPISNTQKEYPYFWNIINAEIDILQNRAFTIPERLLILGYFCQKVNDYIENDTMNKIPGLADMLLDNELCRKISDSLKPPQSESRIAGESLNILINMRNGIQSTTSHSKFTKNLFARVFEHLELISAPDEGENKYRFSVSKYLKLCETFRNIESERSYIIENLLVNLIFSYDPQGGVWGNYFDMTIFYNTLKICAPVFLSENYNDQELALALTYAVKMVWNSNLAHAAAVDNFLQSNQRTLPYAAFLIC